MFLHLLLVSSSRKLEDDDAYALDTGLTLTAKFQVGESLKVTQNLQDCPLRTASHTSCRDLQNSKN